MMDKKQMTELQLYEYLRKSIKDRSKYLARYIDGRKSLLMLALFDVTRQIFWIGLDTFAQILVELQLPSSASCPS